MRLPIKSKPKSETPQLCRLVYINLTQPHLWLWPANYQDTQPGNGGSQLTETPGVYFYWGPVLLQKDHVSSNFSQYAPTALPSKQDEWCCMSISYKYGFMHQVFCFSDSELITYAIYWTMNVFVKCLHHLILYPSIFHCFTNKQKAIHLTGSDTD